MKKFLFLFSVIFLLGCSDQEITPSDTFVKFYGDNADFDLRDMTLDADGGVIMLAAREGEVLPEGATEPIEGVTDFYVVQTDADGNPVVQKRVPVLLPDGVGGSQEDLAFPFATKSPAKITPTASGYLVVGSMPWLKKDGQGSFLEEETSTIIVWAELDVNFDLVGTEWNVLGDTLNNYYGIDIRETPDGGVLVAGYTDLNGNNDFYYTKIGGTNDEWERVQARPASDDRIFRAVPRNSGGFVLIGQTDAFSEDGEGGANVERTIIDDEGVITNSLIYGITWFGDSDFPLTDLWDIPYDLVVGNSGFTIVGTSYTNEDLTGDGVPFFMNVDLTGGISDERNYLDDFSDIDGQVFGISQALNKDYILVGTKDAVVEGNTATSSKELMVFRTDQAGERITDIREYGTINGDESGRKTVVTPQGDILIGANYDFGSDLTQLALLKVNRGVELKP